jgi:RimJ/RimL family protein N-acetyltransferase
MTWQPGSGSTQSSRRSEGVSADPKLPPWEAIRLQVDELVLRPWRAADASAMAAAYQADPEIPRRTGFPYEMTETQASAYIDERRQGWEQGAKAAFGIFDEHGRLLGSISLLTIDWTTGEGEVGFWLAGEARGRGVAVRALVRIVRWTEELGLRRLTATIEVTNDASRRVLERAQFVRERTAPENRELHGQLIDEYVYARRLARGVASTP